MLKGIPPIISPDLIKVLMEMGHGDEIVFVDGNFPAAANAQRLVRCDGHKVPELLDAVLPFFPLDTYIEAPATLMSIVPGDTVVPVIWDDFKEILNKHHGKEVNIEFVDRYAFYERAKNAFAIVATSEKALYANVIITKGVVTE